VTEKFEGDAGMNALFITYIRSLQTCLARGPQTITQQFEGRRSYVMYLFRNMLHSTKSTNVSQIYIYIFYYWQNVLAA